MNCLDKPGLCEVGCFKILNSTNNKHNGSEGDGNMFHVNLQVLNNNTEIFITNKIRGFSMFGLTLGNKLIILYKSKTSNYKKKTISHLPMTDCS